MSIVQSDAWCCVPRPEGGYLLARTDKERCTRSGGRSEVGRVLECSKLSLSQMANILAGKAGK